MLKTKSGEDKVNTLLSTSQIPIIDLAHCGKCKREKTQNGMQFY